MNGEETEGSGDVEEKNCFDPLKVDPLKYLDMFLHLIQLRIPDFFYDKKKCSPFKFFPLSILAWTGKNMMNVTTVSVGRCDARWM